MTPSPDLLAVLREALPELRAVASTIQDCAEISAHSSWADRIDTALARIDSALSAHEAQGWMPIAEAPKDGRLIATWNPRQPSISRFLRWGTPNLSKDRAWITPKGCAPTYLPTQFLILPPPPETTT